MRKTYSLYLHWKQGDDFSSCGGDFAKWCEHFKECVRQTSILQEHQQRIKVFGADTHFIGLDMDEDLANQLIAQGVSLTLEEENFE